jgi:hypothetical protein
LRGRFHRQQRYRYRRYGPDRGWHVSFSPTLLQHSPTALPGLRTLSKLAIS